MTIVRFVPRIRCRCSAVAPIAALFTFAILAGAAPGGGSALSDRQMKAITGRGDCHETVDGPADCQSTDNNPCDGCKNENIQDETTLDPCPNNNQVLTYYTGAVYQVCTTGKRGRCSAPGSVNCTAQYMCTQTDPVANKKCQGNACTLQPPPNTSWWCRECKLGGIQSPWTTRNDEVCSE
jgi:hypothetical protein